MKYIPTICPYCGCGCGLNLVNVNGRVIGVEPWKRHPVNQGKLCPKGNFAHEFIHHEERLTTPLIKEKNQFRRATWDEALNSIASKLNLIKDEDPDAVAFFASARCTNEENYILQKFARAVIGTNNIDNCATLCHGPSVAGLTLTLGSGAMTNSIADLEEADCIFVVGSNALEQHPLIGRRILRAKTKGAKLIVADSRYTITARQADLFLPLIPGCDVALLNSMMNVILNEGLEDREFIKRRIKNFEELKGVIQNYSPLNVEKITGTPSDLIIKAAKCYGEANSASILYSMGVTQHIHGTENVKSIANLAMLTGNIGKKGAGVNPLRGQNNVQGACDMGTLPIFYPGYQQVVIDTNKDKIESEWNCRSLNSLPGLQMMEIMEAAHEGVIKGMFIMGENPMVSDPDLGHVRKSLEKLELLVVQDIFLTETAEIANYILPASSWAEKTGTFTNTERRVQYIRKAVDPPGDAMEDWMIICNLARKMGSSLFEYRSSDEIFQEIRQVTPQYAGMDYDRLHRPEGLQWPCPNTEHQGTPILHEDKFRTSDGKGTFRPVHFKTQLKTLNNDFPFILTTGRVIFQYQTGTMTRRSETLEKQAPETYVEINQEDARQLDIKNGETVVIMTKTGEIQIKAKITPNIMERIIFIPFHYAERGVNVLTSGEFLDPVSKMPEFKLSAAKIKKIC